MCVPAIEKLGFMEEAMCLCESHQESLISFAQPYIGLPGYNLLCCNLESCREHLLIVGVGVYNTLLKDVPLRRMFLWTAILGAALGSTQLILITGTHLLLR